MGSEKIIIIGGGGHAKVLIDSILSLGIYRIEGIVDPAIRAGVKILGYPVLGSDEFLDGCAKGDISIALGIGSIRATGKRKAIYEKFKKRFKCPSIINAHAIIAKSVRYGDGVQIMAGVIIQPDVKIGENTIINTAAIIEHDCKISAHSHVSLNAVLGGGVTIGECSHIGMGAKILQGVKIGSYVTVGAGAVVTKNVEDGKLVCGIPAKEIDE